MKTQTAGVLQASRMDPSLKVPHRSTSQLSPPLSSRPDKLWCLPHSHPLDTKLSEAGGERHPLTSSSIIRDGQEPLWVLSNSIQEFSQPVQSSLDKLTPCPLSPNRVDLTWPFCCVLSHNPPWCNPDPVSPSPNKLREKSREKKRRSQGQEKQSSREGLLKGQRNVYQEGCNKPLL